MKFPLYRLARIAFVLASTMFMGAATAETAYVSDELQITLRTGPGLKNKITSMLNSGEGLEVLQQQSNGYTEVRAANGKTGWVLQRFLMTDPSARSRLDEIQLREQKLAEQQQEIQTLRSAAIESKSQSVAMQGSNANLKAELERVKQIAADTLTINNKNKELATALSRAESKQDSLQVENERLSNNTEQAWFIRGAGVVLLGMFLGFLIPKLRLKKKRKWGDFSSY